MDPLSIVSEAPAPAPLSIVSEAPAPAPVYRFSDTPLVQAAQSQVAATRAANAAPTGEQGWFGQVFDPGGTQARLLRTLGAVPADLLTGVAGMVDRPADVMAGRADPTDVMANLNFALGTMGGAEFPHARLEVPPPVHARAEPALGAQPPLSVVREQPAPLEQPIGPEPKPPPVPEQTTNELDQLRGGIQPPAPESRPVEDIAAQDLADDAQDTANEKAVNDWFDKNNPTNGVGNNSISLRDKDLLSPLSAEELAPVAAKVAQMRAQGATLAQVKDFVGQEAQRISQERVYKRTASQGDPANLPPLAPHQLEAMTKPDPELDQARALAQKLGIQAPIARWTDEAKPRVPNAPADTPKIGIADTDDGSIHVGDPFFRMKPQLQEWVLAHEAGHLKAGIRPAALRQSGLLPQNPELRRTFQLEMTAASQRMNPRTWESAKTDLELRRYLQQPHEVVADAHALWLLHPAEAHRMMPNVSAIFDKMPPDRVYADELIQGIHDAFHADRPLSVVSEAPVAEGEPAQSTGIIEKILRWKAPVRGESGFSEPTPSMTLREAQEVSRFLKDSSQSPEARQQVEAYANYGVKQAATPAAAPKAAKSITVFSGKDFTPGVEGVHVTTSRETAGPEAKPLKLKEVNKLLDMNEDIEGQPPSVRKAVKPMLLKLGYEKDDIEGMSGEDIFDALSTGGDAKTASKRLLDGGVLGTRYNDGEADSFVAFDPSILAEAPLPPRQDRGREAVAKVEDQLHALRTNSTADEIAMRQRLEAMPENMTTPQVQDRLYRAIEEPGTPLKPGERQFAQEHLQPLLDEQAALYDAIKTYGDDNPEEDFRPSESNPTYVHRMVKGRTPAYDPREGPRGSNPLALTTRTLPRTTGSLKGRTLMAIEDESGRRFVVSAGPDGLRIHENGKTTLIPGSPDKLKPGTQFVDKNGRAWDVVQATTREIERHTPVRYYKNAVVNTADNVLRLKRILRNVEFLDNLKKSSAFLQRAVKTSEGRAPDGWKTVDLPQLHGWKLEPDLANAINDAYHGARALGPDSAVLNGLRAANKAAVGSLFFNPVVHMLNEMQLWTVARSWDLVKPAGLKSMMVDGSRAVRSVMKQDHEYQEMLRHGASLMSGGLDAQRFYQLMLRKMGTEMERDPSTWSRIANIAGVKQVKDLVQLIYRGSSKALWGTHDVLLMQRVKELQRKGLSLDQAIGRAEKLMPSYRIPAKVSGTRWVSEIMQDPALTAFGHYHYGVFKSYMEMLKPLVRGSTPEKANALGSMLTLGLMAYVTTPLLNQLVQNLTGNKNAKFGARGSLAPIQSLVDLTQGQKSLVQALEGVVTPAPMTEEAVEQFANRDLFTGAPVYQGPPQQAIPEAAMHAARAAVSPLDQFLQQRNNPNAWMSGFGISNPTEKQTQTKLYYRRKDAEDARKRAMREQAR